MNEITPYACCGETRATPFCPICGKRLGVKPPLVQMKLHLDPGMAKRLVSSIGPPFRQAFAAACDKCLDTVVERLLHAGYMRPNIENTLGYQISYDTYDKITRASALLGITRAELARCCLKVYVDEELQKGEPCSKSSKTLS
ncbi:MAG: hypothetical protein WC919_04150 [Candidatus Paceibacterota bacterium]|jgi:hypothetical protein